MPDSPFSTLKCKIDDVVIRASGLHNSLIKQERTNNTTDKIEVIARAVLPDQNRNISRAKHAVKGGVNVNRLLDEVEINRLISEILEALKPVPTGRRIFELKVSQKKAFLKDITSISRTKNVVKKLDKIIALCQTISSELTILEVHWEPRTILIDGGKQVSGRLQLERLLAKEIDGYLKICDCYCSEETLSILEATQISYPIIVLTCSPQKEDRFVEFLSKIRKEGHPITVIVVIDKSLFPHDRFIICQSQGWQIGGSLKDIGKRPMTITKLETKKEIEGMIDDYATGNRAQIRLL